MKADIKGLLKAVEAGVNALRSETNDASWTPQLGTALGGLRTAQAGLAAHLELQEKPADTTETK